MDQKQRLAHSNAQQDLYREHLENRVLDGEIHVADLRREILTLLAELRYMRWFVRYSREQLAEHVG